MAETASIELLPAVYIMEGSTADCAVEPIDLVNHEIILRIIDGSRIFLVG